MKKLLFLLVILMSASASHAQFKLSDQAEVSIITCGPSQHELYTAFGHSAIRIHDAAQGMDYAFNYGLFSFDQPYFYLNFARGSSFYILGVQNYADFKYSYEYYNRSIHEQLLNLNSEQKQKIFDFLQVNALPENRSYRYDYFYDNCATRVRDAFEKALPHEIVFDSTYITTDYSIRDLTDIYLSQQPWGDLGIDICLGLPMDKKASPYEYMFLPDYIESSFDHATVNGQPLVKSSRVVYKARPEEVKGLPHPLIFFSALLLIAAAVTFYDWRRKKLSLWFDSAFFLILGLIGVLLILLWTATDHRAAAYNFNLLWALPTHLVAVIAFIKKPKWLSNYFLGVSLLSVLVLITWPWLPQKLNHSLVPLVGAIAMRAFIQYRVRKQEPR